MYFCLPATQFVIQVCCENINISSLFVTKRLFIYLLSVILIYELIHLIFLCKYFGLGETITGECRKFDIAELYSLYC